MNDVVGRRILLVYEPGRRGAAALEEVRRLAPAGDGALTVVALAPRQPYTRCGPGGEALDAAVVEAAGRDLAAARRGLGPLADAASFRILTGDAEHALRELVSRGGFDLVVAPGRRMDRSAPAGGER